MKKIIILFAVMIFAVTNLITITYASSDEWRTAYEEIIINKVSSEDFEGNVFQLADIDTDGIAELLIGTYPGEGMYSRLEGLYTFKGNNLKALSADAGVMLGSNYELYRNDISGEFRLTGTYSIRNSWTYHSSYKGIYSMNDTVTFSNHFEKVKVVSDATYEESNNYYVNGEKVTSEDYNYAMLHFNDGWTKAEQYYVSEMALASGMQSPDKISGFVSAHKNGCAKTLDSRHNLEVNGEAVKIPGYIISDSNYYKLRDIAMIFENCGHGFEIGYNPYDKSVAIDTSKPYTAVGGELLHQPVNSVNPVALYSDSRIRINGEATLLTAYNINGNNYFKIRDLADALGFGITWDAATSTVKITL